MTPALLTAQVARDYPGAWAAYDRILRDRGRDLPDWPAWCFCPLAAAAAIAPNEVARVGAAAAWRARPLVWRGATSEPTDAPLSALLELPRWCTWVEPVTGPPGWVHLEHDVNTGRPELRFCLLLGVRLVGIPLHLDHRTVASAIDAALGEVVAHAGAVPSSQVDATRGAWSALLATWVPLAQRLAREPGLAVTPTGP